MIRSSGKFVKTEELRHRITIQKLLPAKDKEGFEVPQWIDLKAVWAKVENLYGREFYAAAAVQQEKTVKFVIRYLKGLDESMRIKFGKKTVSILDDEGNIIDTKEVDKVFDIKFVDNIKYANRFMEVQAMEDSTDG